MLVVGTYGRKGKGLNHSYVDPAVPFRLDWGRNERTVRALLCAVEMGMKDTREHVGSVADGTLRTTNLSVTIVKSSSFKLEKNMTYMVSSALRCGCSASCCEPRLGPV